MLINFFLSQARADSRLILDFSDRLEPRLKIQKSHEFRLWSDRDLLVGTDADPEIARRFADSDFILQAVSPHFLISDYIKEHEIPGLGDTPMKRTLPFMLVDVPLKQNQPVELLGIEKRQIFQGEWGNKTSFEALNGDHEKNNFVDGFVAEIVRRVEEEIGISR